MKNCRHCGHESGYARQHRGLCWSCYNDFDIRDQYPSFPNRFSRRGVLDFCGVPPEPRPTDAQPGTEEKMKVLAERAERGEALHHRRDPQNFSWMDYVSRNRVHRLLVGRHFSRKVGNRDEYSGITTE